VQRPGNLIDPKIAALYRAVPAAEIQRFQEFLRQHPYQRFSHAGVAWSYLTLGSGEQTLLLLPGALAVPEVSWQLLLRFAKHFTILCPVYAAVDSMDALTDGIAAILQHTGAAQAHVLGGSYGGFVAQVFVRRCPQLTRSLILSHTQPPAPESAGSVRSTFGLMPLLHR
jgi:pimeloyl-ACP methyl ester carboxylesterase